MGTEAGVDGIGLYLHWPFCQSKCPYCDFNSHVSARTDQSRWLRTYLTEIDRYGAMTSGRKLRTVFFGGGTPSLMDPDLVSAILGRIQATWPVANDWEVTLEANPGSVEAGRFRAYREAGVNRLSLGVQALNDEDLRRLGRLHSAQEAIRAFEIARHCFNRVSFDLIYARQGQTIDGWMEELNVALGLAVDHLSLYQLTVEDGTPFADRLSRGRLRGLPDEELSAALYQATQDACGMAGLPAYEVSNHAGADARCEHNLNYWRCGDYVGIGPGAHGRLTFGKQRLATEAIREPGAWLAAVETSGAGDLPSVELSPVNQSDEYLIMGLRLTEGIDVGRHESLSGLRLDPGKLDGLCEMGLLESANGRIAVTDRGRLLLNAIIRELSAP